MCRIRTLIVILIVLIFSTSMALAAKVDVEAGADAISGALAGAFAGDTLVLVTDGGMYTESAALTIDKDVAIVSDDELTALPTWKTAGENHISLQSDLILQGIVFEGFTDPDTVVSGVINSSTTPNNLLVSGCEFQNFKENGICKQSDEIGAFDSLKVSDCLFHDSEGGVVLDGYKDAEPNVPGTNYLSIDNSTFYNMSDAAVKLEAYSPAGSDSTVAEINHLTVHNCVGEGIYLKKVGSASVVTNCIVTNCDAGVAIKYGPPNIVVTYSDIWNNGTDFKGSSDGGCSAGVGTFSEDPRFVDAANGDFRFINSRVNMSASDGDQMGDTRWNRYDDGPPDMAVNTIGPGSITVDPQGPYAEGDMVTLTAVPDAGAVFLGWLGDYVSGTNLTETITLPTEGHAYATAQFAPADAEIVLVNGTNSSKVDWSVIAVELVPGSEIKHKETQVGEVTEGGSDTLTVTSSILKGVAGDLYLAAISTKGHSHGHPHNTTVVQSISGLGLNWTLVKDQRGFRNATHLTLYMAQGTPTGDDSVTAVVSNFPAGQNIALSVTRYSGVDATNPIGNVISHNSQGFNGPGVELTGYPRPSSSHDKPAYTVKLPVNSSKNVCAFIAHRNVTHIPGAKYAERIDAAGGTGGDTNTIAVVDNVSPSVNLIVEIEGSGSVALTPAAGDVTVTSDTLTYVPGTQVIIEAIPDEDWLFKGWSGDLSGMTNPDTLVLDVTKSIKASFNQGEVVDLNATFDHAVDYVVLAAELQRTGSDVTVTHEETQTAIIEMATDDTLNITTDNDLKAADGAAYLAVISTKKRSMVVNVSGLGLNWEFVNDQAGARNQTFLSLWMAKGTPASDGPVTAKVTDVLIGKDIAFSVSRYSGVDTLGNVLSANTFGVDGEETGGTDVDRFTIPLSRKKTSSLIFTAVAHRAWTFTPGAGNRVRSFVKAATGGNTTSATIADYLYHPIEVASGTGALSAALATAPEESFLLLMDNGPYMESDSVVVDKDIYIWADTSSTPLIKTQANFTLEVKSDLNLKGVIFDGGNRTESAIINRADVPNNLIVEGCEFRNFTDVAIGNDEDQDVKPVNSLKVSNSLFHDNGSGIVLDGDHPDGQPELNLAGALNLSVENCTFYKMEEVGIKLEAYPKPAQDSAFVNINHVTINGCGEEAVYIKSVTASSVITNSIVTSSGAGIRFKYAPTSFAVTYSDVWNNTENYKDGPFAGEGTIEQDPCFIDVENGDFNFLTGSPCGSKASDGENMGDLRWSVMTAIAGNQNKLPETFSLSQNFPNPFNPTTMIKYQLPKSCDVKLIVYNVMGRKVATLYDDHQKAGNYSIQWDGLDDQGNMVSSGMYFYKINAGAFTNTLKMMLVK